MDQRTRAKMILAWRQWVRPLAITIIVTSAARSAIADWNVVPSGSMNPNIISGDRILVNKLAYGLRVPFTNWMLMEWSEPARGEVVVFFGPDSGKRLVKRVVGLPGDTIRLWNNRLVINGEFIRYALDEDTPSIDSRGAYRVYTEKLPGHAHPIMITSNVRARRFFGPVTVPEDHYFVMGDNRDNSRDSRWFGFVSRRPLVGRSSRVIMSLDPDNYYLPRSDRFCRSLP